MSEEKEVRTYVAPQWKLVWWKFRQHRLAFASGIVVVIIYLISLFVEFLAPFPADKTDSKYLYAPPQRLRLRDGDGRFGLFLNGYTSKIEPEALRRVFTEDPSIRIEVGFFVKGYRYKLFGFLPGDRHLIAPKDPAMPMYLLGADRLGRDLASRLIWGTRVSMSIGLIGVFLSLVLGILLGGLSGYFGGALDSIIQRSIEFFRSIPSIPLWMGLAAAFPASMPPLQVYFGITVILSLIGWTGLARVVRGKFLSLREEDFILAATLDGVPRGRMIFTHMIPSFLSHIIARVTLMIPWMILGETALSFLGLGLREPVVSWGVMLKETQKVGVIASFPWLLYPAVAVIIVVLALNFLGDGLRDAADPYQSR